ncbi:WAS/WASL-interacting protein family member 2 [Platysternon megacephalum]|uniref:WAS/WASL-interacting protein family member 2 n=1 Tax=Platysternon megacephalum TaxID=55544 RepID=A0A4D9F030_9SAUR|nr:WAS/WASL-interacting protein family member 2 [Platysternon megacephalum]
MQETWDAALARTARAWAKKCLFKHSPYLTEKFMSHPHYGHVGENIWTGHYGLFGVAEAIKLWTDEVQHYNLQTNKCTKTCGHYTQVVWDNSHKVGCAVVFCRIAAGIRDAAHFICNYVPSGNYPRKPYKAGSSCSLCSKEDTCVDNLCSVQGQPLRQQWQQLQLKHTEGFQGSKTARLSAKSSKTSSQTPQRSQLPLLSVRERSIAPHLWYWWVSFSVCVKLIFHISDAEPSINIEVTNQFPYFYVEDAEAIHFLLSHRQESA